jgi:hypothetical protein
MTQIGALNSGYTPSVYQLAQKLSQQVSSTPPVAFGSYQTPNPTDAAEKYKAQGAQNGIEHQNASNCFGCAGGNLVAAITGKQVTEDQVNTAINHGHGSVDGGGSMQDAADVANEVAGKKVAEVQTASSDQDLKDKMQKSGGKPVEVTVNMQELTGEKSIDKPTGGKMGSGHYGKKFKDGDDDGSGGGSGNGDDHAVLAYAGKNGGFDIQDTGTGKWYHVDKLKDGGCSHDNQVVASV